MLTDIPDGINEITADWLTAALADSGFGTIQSIAVEPVGEAGTLSSMARCRLRYREAGSQWPRSVIVKLMPADPAVRQTAEELRTFEHEIRFYSEIASDLPLRVPQFFFGSCAGHRAVLVLEDLGGLLFCDQIDGLNHAQTVAAAQTIAGLHAQFWEKTQTKTLDWVPVDDFAITQSYADAWPDFENAYGTRIGEEAVALGRRLGPAKNTLLADVARRPHTLCHGDLRADNLFFDGLDVVVIDWQMSTRSVGALDVARLMGASEPHRGGSDRSMEPFEAWHDELVRLGVTDYSRQAAFDDLRLAALLNLFRPIHVFAKWGAAPGGRKGRFLDAIATRHFAFAVDIGASAFLDQPGRS